jgi:hypothetical protein
MLCQGRPGRISIGGRIVFGVLSGLRCPLSRLFEPELWPAAVSIITLEAGPHYLLVLISRWGLRIVGRK